MIRINLSKNLVLGSGSGDSELLAEPTDQKIIFKNLGMILVFPILVYAGKAYVQSQMNNENQVLRGQLSSLQVKVTEFGQTSKVVEKLVLEKKELDDHLKQIAIISRSRLLPLKALDAIPSLLPQSTWLHSLELADGKKEEGNLFAGNAAGDGGGSGYKVVLEAYSLNPNGSALFMQAFEESIFFSRAVLASSSREESPLGELFKFTLEVNVEGAL